MAMAVHDGFPTQRGRLETRRVMSEKFAQQESLSLQPLCLLIEREEIRELVPEYGCACRLEDDQRRAGANILRQGVENFLQVALRAIQHAPFVQRPAATQVPFRYHHLAASVLQDFVGCNRGLRVKVIVERIRPQKHTLSLRALRTAVAQPGTKAPPGKRRNRALPGHTDR